METLGAMIWLDANLEYAPATAPPATSSNTPAPAPSHTPGRARLGYVAPAFVFALDLGAAPRLALASRTTWRGSTPCVGVLTGAATATGGTVLATFGSASGGAVASGIGATTGALAAASAFWSEAFAAENAGVSGAGAVSGASFMRSMGVSTAVLGAILVLECGLRCGLDLGMRDKGASLQKLPSVCPPCAFCQPEMSRI